MFYFLRWICCIFELIDGIVGTLTFGFYTPYFSLYAEDWFLTYNEKHPITLEK